MRGLISVALFVIAVPCSMEALEVAVHEKQTNTQLTLDFFKSYCEGEDHFTPIYYQHQSLILFQ